MTISHPATHFFAALIAAYVLAAAALAGATDSKTGYEAALEFIGAQKPPVFAAEHRLAPLTLWRQMHHDIQKALTEQWGYAWYGVIAGEGLEKLLDDPSSGVRRMLEPTIRDPKRYPLEVCIRPAGSMGLFAKKFPDDAFLRDAEGKLLLRGKSKIWSPVADDKYWEEIADYHVAMLAAIRKHAPITIVINGGEYGFNAFGHIGKLLTQDPRVVAAKGSQTWPEFLADRKSRYNRILCERIHKAVPDLKYYILYKDTAAGHPHRSTEGGGWANWGSLFRKGASDLGSGESYWGSYTTGFTGKSDLLTQFLNARTQEIAAGEPLAYYFVSAGWLRGEGREKAKQPMAPPELYMGFLKCLYAGGTVGNVAGYFGSQPDSVAAEVERTMPPFLALGHVHALFSHLEEFLGSGDLLPGPDKHHFSTDLPACEFPTGAADARIIVRRHKQGSRWLVAAWAADGKQCEVQTQVPDLGPIKVIARPVGSVYVFTKDAAGKVTSELQDPNPLDPTATWRLPGK